MSLLSTWMAAQPNKLPPKQRLLEAKLFLSSRRRYFRPRREAATVARLGRLDAAVNNAEMEVEATLYRRRRRGRV
jgi:hypothetical protein